MKREQIIYNILIGIVACLLPFLSSVSLGLFSRQVCITSCAIFVICILVRIFSSKSKVLLSVSKHDGFVCLYLMYGCFHFFIFRHDLPFVLFAQWVMLVGTYIVSRNMHNLYFSLLLWGSCTLQAIIGLAQSLRIVESNHVLFLATGSFWNPSQLGGFIACFLPLFASELIVSKKSIWHWLCLLPMACALVLSDSRAAWLACGVGVLYILPIEFKSKAKIGLASLGVLLVSIGLYFYKPLSAAGRLYVWWISKDMLLVNPMGGNGIHSFGDKYMLYQANYFHEHPESDFAGIASSITTPYNEFIHVLVEQGIVGFLLFLFLFGSYFFLFQNKEDKKYQGVVLAFLLFACFSYPGENPALLFGLVVCMGAVRSQEWFSLRLYSFRKYVILVMLVGCIYMNMRIVKEYCSLSCLAKSSLDPINLIRYKNEPEVLQYLLSHNKALNVIDQIQIQEWISEKIPIPETYCELGKLYELSGEYDRAERYYQIAADMIPNQVRGNYFLFKLYEKTGQDIKAQEMANIISQQNIKIENTFTLSVQGEIKRFLNRRK